MNYLQGYSEYFFETLKTKTTGFLLPITSTCNSDCLFCSNENNPFEIRKCKFRDFEEIKRVLWSVKTIKGPIMLNYGVTALSEGECTIHPQFIEILRFLRSKYENWIQVSTNGSTLTRERLQEFADIQKIGVILSFHAVDREQWKEIFKLGDKQYDIAKASIRIMKELGVVNSPRIVAMPGLIGYAGLTETARYLHKYVPTATIGVVQAKYTKYNSLEVIRKLQADPAELAEWYWGLYKEIPNLILSCDPVGDLLFSGEFDLPEDLVNRINKIDKCGRVSKIYFFTSSPFRESLLDNLLKRCSNQTSKEVVVVPNASYGGNISCANLWLLKDIEDKIEELNLRNQYIIMPGGFLDRYGYDLTGRNVYDVINEKNRDKYNNNLYFSDYNVINPGYGI